MNSFLTLVKREFHQFRTNSVAVAIFLGAPILYGFLFGFVYQEAKVTELPIVVVDLDDSPLSHRLTDALEDNEYIKIKEVVNQTGSLYKTVTEEGMHAVVTIPSQFEADIQQKRHPEIDVDINAANILTANYVARGIQHTLGVINAGVEIESLKKQGTPEAAAMEKFEAFQVNYNRLFNPSANYLLFLWPGMLATIMQQVFLLVLALSFSKEFDDLTFGKLRSYSGSTLLILLGKSLPYWLMGAGLWWFVLGVMFPLFDIPLVTDWAALWILSILFTLSLTFMGVLVSMLIPSQLKATEILMIIATPSFVVSGFTWPLDQMPGWVQVIADMIPLTHFLHGFRKLLMYNANFQAILPNVQALGIITIVTFLASWVMLHLKLKQHTSLAEATT